MATFKHARICRECGRKRRLDVDNFKCAECNGLVSYSNTDDSPAVLTGRWVPHPSLPIRVYVEKVAG